jgi:hypothetical protein
VRESTNLLGRKHRLLVVVVLGCLAALLLSVGIFHHLSGDSQPNEDATGAWALPVLRALPSDNSLMSFYVKEAIKSVEDHDRNRRPSGGQASSDA